MRLAVSLVLSLVFWIATVQAEDGGVLVFNSKVLSETAPAPWPLDSSLLVSEQPATMQLDGMGPEKVFTGYSNITGGRVAVSVNPPNRLFIDQNGDEKCESVELYYASKSNSSWGLFEGVPQRVTLGGITQTILIDINVSAYTIGKREVCYAHVKRVQSGYQGTVRIGGTEYPALLIYRNYFSNAKSIDAVILLDTNRNGIFEHFSDSWMLANGIGSSGGELWNVVTTFTEETATVTVTPYIGETGFLQVTGEGVLRVYLQVLDSTRTPQSYRLSSDKPFLCLEKPKRGLYKLPVGDFLINDAWVGSPTGTDTFFRMNERSGVPNRRTQYKFSVIEGATVTESLGGPVSMGMGTDPSLALLGYVFLDPKDFENSAGIQFQPTGLDGERISTPTYEVRNRSGRVVTTGKIEYG